jgi:putative DNA primase/helicase
MPTRALEEPTADRAQVDLLVFKHTDYGAAERLHAAFGKEFRHCDALGFLVWDGTRWKPDENETLMRRLALETARQLFAQAATLNDNQREAWVKHSLSCERGAALKTAVEFVKTVPGVKVTVKQLDRDPMLLNVENGTLDLNTGKLRPHNPLDLITKLAPVTFDPTAECPRWLEFQRTICADDDDLIAFKQRAYGYTATGKTSEDALFIAYGSGANGKSTELDAVLGILGDYANTAQFETFAVKKNEGVRNDLADLVGARFVSASEGENRQRLAEGLVKQLTGGDVLKARFLHREFFRFKPEFKIWLATNHKPVINGTDGGIWRRIRLVPYSVTIAPEKRDKRLREKLQAEKSGILNWILEGCKLWLEHGLGSAEAVTAATESYRQESDALLEFMTARCVVGEAHSELAGNLYAAYQHFCEESGEEAFSSTLFGRMLTERGYIGATERRAGKVVKVRLGVALAEEGDK